MSCNLIKKVSPLSNSPILFLSGVSKCESGFIFLQSGKFFFKASIQSQKKSDTKKIDYLQLDYHL